MKHSKLGLGGHSFIEQLGNDPRASFEEQCGLVSACLDSGIRLIDTTYYQERVALGKVLQHLGRRNEAEIMAWNFFQQTSRRCLRCGSGAWARPETSRTVVTVQVRSISTRLGRGGLPLR